MKIVFINGSPKQGESTSQQIIEYLLERVAGNENEVQTFFAKRKKYNTTFFTAINEADVLMFVFPLYIDSIPSNVLRLLEMLEETGFQSKTKKVYAIINNGFYEGTQNHIVIKQLKRWCDIVQLDWGQAIGIGAGEMIPFIKNVPLGYGPNKNFGLALNTLLENMKHLLSGEDMFVSLNWPHFLWKVQSSLFFWFPRAKKNKLKLRSLYMKQS